MPIGNTSESPCSSKVTVKQYGSHKPKGEHTGSLSSGVSVKSVLRPAPTPFVTKVDDMMHDDARVPTPIRAMPHIYGLRLLPQDGYPAPAMNKAQQSTLYAACLEELYTHFFRLPKEWAPITISKEQDLVIRKNIKRIMYLHDDPLARHEKFLWLHNVFSGALAQKIIQKMKDSPGCPKDNIDRWTAFSQMIEPIAAVYQGYLSFQYSRVCAKKHFT